MSHKWATYKVIDPDGKEYVVSNGLGKFCTKNNLCRSKMVSVSSGARNHHKGWRCIKIKDEYKVDEQTYLLESPSGTQHIISKLSDFASKENLDKKRLVEVANGQRSIHKGWKCSYFTP